MVKTPNIFPNTRYN